MKNIKGIVTINRIVSVLLLMMLILPGRASAQENQTKRDTFRYVVNQTFDGGSFFKDNNVWVYNQKFADTFGMPPEGIYPELKGIEAAAFRIEDCNYKMCGLGGKAENCKDNYRCVTDIYIDETKTPLPWSTDQKADWVTIYNSTNWLRTPTEFLGKGVVPSGVIPNKMAAAIRPFADPETHREANWFHNANNDQFDDKGVVHFLHIYGYKRQAIAGLTMITLDYNCLRRHSKKTTVTFRLESREEIASPTLKRFHEFRLPDVFLRKIDKVLNAKIERDMEYYKNLLKNMNKKKRDNGSI